MQETGQSFYLNNNNSHISTFASAPTGNGSVNAIDLINKFNPKLLTTSNEYPSSYKELKKVLSYDLLDSKNASLGDISFDDDNDMSQMSQMSQMGNLTAASINTTNNIIDNYFELTAIDLEDSIIYENNLSVSDDILLKKEDYFLQLKLCTEYAIFRAKNTDNNTTNSNSYSELSMIAGSSSNRSSTVSNNKNGVFDDDDEYFIRNWRYLIKELKHLEVLQKELTKKSSTNMNVSNYESVISNMEKIILLKDRLNNGLLRQLSKISFPDLNVDIKDYITYTRNKKSRNGYNIKQSKYKNTNKSIDNLRLFSNDIISNTTRSARSSGMLDSLLNSTQNLDINERQLYSKNSGEQDYSDPPGINDDENNHNGESFEGESPKFSVDDMTSYLISEVIKHDIHLPMNDSSDTFNNVQFLKSCIDALIESSKTSQQVKTAPLVTAQNSTNETPSNATDENTDLKNVTQVVAKDSDKQDTEEEKNYTKEQEDKTKIDDQKFAITELKTALKDLQLAHNFLTDKFAKDRFEYVENIDKLTKKISSMSNELNEYQVNLQYEQDKYLKIVHDINEKDAMIDSLKSTIASQEKFNTNLQMSTLPPQSPSLNAVSPQDFSEPETASLNSASSNFSPASNSQNSTSYTLSLMRQEFKKIMQQMNTQHELEMKQEIDRRLKLEAKLSG